MARPNAFGPHPTAHQLGQAPADGQAEAGAAVLARRARVGLRERLEEARQALGAEADAGVAHREGEADAAVSGRRARHRQHDLAALGELDRVGEQVEEDLAQPRQVGADRHRDIAFEHVRRVEVLLGCAHADEIERRLDAIAQVERMRLDVHPPGLDLREVEDVVDDREERVPAVPDRPGEVALLVRKRRVEQQPAHADDGVHRRADLVAHRRQERALGLVGGLGCGAGELGLGERLRRAPDRDRADGAALPQHGRHEQRIVLAEAPGGLAQGLGYVGIVEHVGVGHRTAFADRHLARRALQRLREQIACARGPFALRGADVQQVVVAGQEYEPRVPAEQMLDAAQDLVKHRLGVGHRVADHAQDARRGVLLLERLPGLVEEARVLDRDHRLVGEGLDQRHLPVRKRVDLTAPERDYADQRTLPKQRHR